MGKLKVGNKEQIEKQIEKNKSINTTRKNIAGLIDKVFEFGNNGGIIVSMHDMGKTNKKMMIDTLKKTGFEVTEIVSGRVRIKSEE